MLTGVDVSNNNGSVEWHRVGRAGHAFAIVKVSEGDFLDPTCMRARIDAIRAAGMVPGGYVFLRPRKGRTGAQEVRRHFWPHARAAGLFRDGDVLPVLDVEASAFDVSTAGGRWATRRYVKSAVKELVRLTGQKPIIYTGFFWRDTLRNPRSSFGCRLWYPHYEVAAPSNWPRAWRAPAIWQWTEHGACPGISGRCDLNRYMGGSAGASASARTWTKASFLVELCLRSHKPESGPVRYTRVERRLLSARLTRSARRALNAQARRIRVAARATGWDKNDRVRRFRGLRDRALEGDTDGR